MTAAEIRRRVRANQALHAKTQELAASEVLSKRRAAQEAAAAKEVAELAAREAVAAVLRLFDNDVTVIAGLLDVPADELEREAKPVTAARAKEVVAELRDRAERPRARRSPAPRPSSAPAPEPVPGEASASPADGLTGAA
ncbi:hypothetical protein GCM10017688_06050 [Streptomyces ramulosus]